MTGKRAILIAGIIAIIGAFVMSGCQHPAAPKQNKKPNPTNPINPENPGVIAPEGSYRVSVQPTARGTITLDKPSGFYLPDEMVTMTIEPEDGFECAYLQAVITDVANAPIYGNLSDRTRIFRMPTANVIVYVGFVLKSRNSISVGEQVYGKIVSISHTEAARNTVVTVTVEPDPGHELEAGGIRIVGNDTGASISANRGAKRNEYSFMMIPEPITVHAFFFDTSKEQFIIQTDAAKDQSGNAVVIKGMAAAGETVTIAMYLKDDHMLLAAPLVTFKGAPLTAGQNAADPSRWTFVMPAEGQIVSGESVSVKVVWKMIPMYAISAGITEDSIGEGRFIVEGLNNAGKIAPGGEITLALRVYDAENFFYKQGSIAVVNAANTTLTSRLTSVENNWSGDTVWKFAVPETEPAAMVETLKVSAFIDTIPAHLVTFAGLDDNGKKAGTIEIAPIAVGKDILAGELKVREGKTTTAVLKYDEEDYTFTPGSLKVRKTSNGQEIQVQREDEMKVTFVMHPEPITVSAGLSAKPFLTITKKDDYTGTIRVAISSESGSKENARAGYTIAIHPVPTPGYTGANTTPVITPSVASLKKVNDVWTFTMPSSNVSIAWEFMESGNIVIFKGEPKLAGLTVVQSPWDYGNAIDFVDWDENTNGRQPGTKAIRIGPNSKTGNRPYAPGPGVGAAEVGFGLSVPESLDASWAGAVSFYMRQESASTENPVVSWAGFGDANRAVWYGDTNGQSITGSNQWKRYIVPVPAPRDGMKMNRVFFWKAYGNAVWLIDDIEFISAAQVELDSITIPAAYPGQIPPNEPREVYQMINNSSRIGFTYKTTRGDPASATMFVASGDGAVTHNWGYWIPTNRYTYKVYGTSAELSGTVVTPLTQGGSFELTLSLGQVESNKMEVTIERDDLKIVNDWEDGAGIGAPGAVGTGDNRYFKTFGYSVVSTAGQGANGSCGEYKFKTTDTAWQEQWGQSDLVAGRRFTTPQDYSSYDTVSFWVQTGIQGEGTAMSQANRYSFIFFTGGTGNNYPSATGTAYAATNLSHTETASGTWREVRVSMNNFGALNKSAITGWAVKLDSYGTISGNAEHVLRIDTVTVQKN